MPSVKGAANIQCEPIVAMQESGSNIVRSEFSREKSGFFYEII